jgi:hypothetical protein
MSDFATQFAALKHALEAVAPATKAIIDRDAYPGLKVDQAPAEQTDLEEPVKAALEAAEWPECGTAIPYPSELSDEQRQLADLLAGAVGVPLYAFAIPQTRRTRRLWLGLDDAGALAREVTYKIEDDERTAPLWRALWEIDDEGDSDDAEALFEALPLAERIEAYGELVFEGFRVEPPVEIEAPGADAGEWATAYADRLVGMFADGAPHIERDNNSTPPSGIRALVFAALRKAGIDFEPRWDAMLPFDLDLLDGLPPERVAPIIVRGLEDEFPSWAIKKGYTALERFPSAPIVTHMLERADQCLGSIGCPPRRQVLANLRELLAEQAELVAMVDAHIAALPEIPKLTCTRKLYPKSADELTEGQRTQLAILGRGWETDDGQIVEEGEDGEVVFNELDFVSAYEIADADGNPAFEALLYMDEDGAVCRAGTTNSVAYVCQERLEWNIDVETLEALHAILRERPAQRAD